MHAVLLSDMGSHWTWAALGLLSVPVLVALNGFFVAAEFGRDRGRQSIKR
jgi:hypothetical protein